MVDATHVESSALDGALPLLRALADPTRLRVVALLSAGPRCACVLQAEIDVAANLLSHHLRVLREAGVVASTRRGRWVDYRLHPQALEPLRAALAGLSAAPTPRGPRTAAGRDARGAA